MPKQIDKTINSVDPAKWLHAHYNRPLLQSKDGASTGAAHSIGTIGGGGEGSDEYSPNKVFGRGGNGLAGESITTNSCKPYDSTLSELIKGMKDHQKQKEEKKELAEQIAEAVFDSILTLATDFYAELNADAGRANIFEGLRVERLAAAKAVGKLMTKLYSYKGEIITGVVGDELSKIEISSEMSKNQAPNIG